MQLGPILVHQTVDFSAFNYFASSLVGCRRDLRKLMACGTDGDKALIGSQLPILNVQEKLKSLGLSAVSQEFLDDIFGKRVGNTFQEGLVDAYSIGEFEERLRHLESLWYARELPYAPVSGPPFPISARTKQKL